METASARHVAERVNRPERIALARHVMAPACVRAVKAREKTLSQIGSDAAGYWEAHSASQSKACIFGQAEIRG